MPLALVAAGSDHESRLLESAAGNARARTLRMRIRAVRKMCDWLEAVHGSPKLSDPLAVIEYMYDTLAMKPLRTFPTTLMAAISFVEDRGD
eukprot:5240304-Karenia_brevis.AAC.1